MICICLLNESCHTLQNWPRRSVLLCLLWLALQRDTVCCSVLQCVAACIVIVGHVPRMCNDNCERCPTQIRLSSSVLQCVVECCSVLQSVAVCCIVQQSVAVCCSVLQCVEICCSVLQCVAVCYSVLLCYAVCCSVSVAVCFSALQCVVVWCSV